MNSFSALGLGEIPGVIKSCTSNINLSISQMQSTCYSIRSTIYGNIGAQWGDVANYYGKLNEKIISVTTELIETINKYIDSTITNERNTAVDVSGINEQLQHISEQLNDIVF